MGGKVDTSVGGGRPPIEIVSTAYEGGSSSRLFEMFPGYSAGDTVWTVYDTTGSKPAGWDSYWGGSLPYRPVAAENFYCRYSDDNYVQSGQIPLGIHVIQESYSWTEAIVAGIQILQFKIMNNSARVIDSAYVGFMCDADVGPVNVLNFARNNAAGYFQNLRTAYVQNPVDAGSTPIGLRVLNTHHSTTSHFTFTWYSLDQPPVADTGRYALMSSNRIKQDQYPALSDTRFLLSFGPFTIRPAISATPDTLIVAFALIAGDNLHQLQSRAVYAESLYSGIVLDVKTSDSRLPDRFELEQNFPNPFNPSTTIKFGIAKTSHVELKVFDILGREVAVLVNDVKTPGTHSVTLDGQMLASGLYFYTLRAGDYFSVKKALLLK